MRAVVIRSAGTHHPNSSNGRCCTCRYYRVTRSLGAVRKGGTVVCAGIHMSDIPSFPYAILWGERRLLSVANLARRFRNRQINGAAVLVMQ